MDFFSIFLSLKESYLIKSLLSTGCLLLVYLFGADAVSILDSLVILIFIDQATGMLKAHKKNELSSKGMMGFFRKIILYSGALIGVNHLANFYSGEYNEILQQLRMWTPIYIGFTEAKSIKENLEILGFKTPSVEKLKTIIKK